MASHGSCDLVVFALWYVPSNHRVFPIPNMEHQAGAVFARMVPPTHTEKEMRRRLAELRVLEQEGSGAGAP